MTSKTKVRARTGVAPFILRARVPPQGGVPFRAGVGAGAVVLSKAVLRTAVRVPRKVRSKARVLQMVKWRARARVSSIGKVWHRSRVPTVRRNSDQNTCSDQNKNPD